MPSFNPTRDIPPLSGKIALVTGANSGIGFQTTLLLLQHGAKVWITCRSAEKCAETVRRLGELVPDLGEERVGWLVLDLSTIRGAKAAAEELLRREGRLDILINNAGQLATPFKLTNEGLSDIMVSNHLGPFVFTTTLLPLLEQTAKLPGADVRVITVASSQHLSALPTTKFETVEDFREPFGTESTREGMAAQMARYRQTKLANVLFAKELQRRLDQRGLPILSISLHPGDVATEGGKRMTLSLGGSLLGPLAWRLITLFVMTPEQGAYTSLFAATSPGVRREEGRYKGLYLVPYGTVSSTSELARREGWGEQMWALTEKVVERVEREGRV